MTLHGEKTKILNLPMNLVLLYIAFSLVTFLASTNVNIIDAFLTTLYVVVCMAFLYLGYFIPGKIKRVDSSAETNVYQNDKKIRLLISICAIAVIVTSINNVMTYYPTIQSAINMLAHPAKAYEYVKMIRRVGAEIVRTSSFVGVMLTSLTFSKYIMFSTIFQTWAKLKQLERGLVLCAIAVYLVHAFLIGAMVNIGTLAMSMVPGIILALKDVYFDKKKSRRLMIIVATIFLFTIILLAYFLGSRGVYGNQSKFFGGRIWDGIIGLSDYVSQGYTGLSQCLKLPFVPTWGYTSFYGISTKIGPVLGIPDLFQNSYLYRNALAGGQPALQNWSTIFPWLASDVSFVFIPIIMLMVGRLFKKAWIKCNISGDIGGVALCGQLCILLFMIPANNQIFHTFANATSAIAIYILYRVERKLFC